MPKWRWHIDHLQALTETIVSNDDAPRPSEILPDAFALMDEGGLVHHVRLASVQDVSRRPFGFAHEAPPVMATPKWAWYVTYLYGRASRIPSDQDELRASDIVPEAFVITDDEGIDHHIRYAAVQGLVRAPGTRREHDPSIVTDDQAE